MTRPSWLGRAARNRHHHAIEQASRRWRGGRRDDSARTRRKILISTQVGALAQLQVGPDAGNLTGARRAAEICAANLGSHDDLVEDYNVLANTYDVFGDSSDTESETESSSTD